MDQGDAAVWAAAITGCVGVGGAVAAYLAGRAQAKGVVEGVNLQLAGQRDHELWVDQRDAYASFLSCIESIRTAIDMAIRATVLDREERTPPQGETWSDAMDQLDMQFKAIQGLQSKLKMSVDGPEIEQADLLTIQARVARTAVGEWSHAVSAYLDDEDDRWAEMTAAITDFAEGSRNWAENARTQLRGGS
ncbi:hypothetical protein ACFXGT_28450 [Streptomyces sp. NPDC059352]|uniref:hypothetical protein n=1 Tax=Streptomyces sp. NPDC059352 TaxID=3346810 RepID=UPI0036871F33